MGYGSGWWEGLAAVALNLTVAIRHPPAEFARDCQLRDALGQLIIRLSKFYRRSESSVSFCGGGKLGEEVGGALQWATTALYGGFVRSAWLEELQRGGEGTKVEEVAAAATMDGGGGVPDGGVADGGGGGGVADGGAAGGGVADDGGGGGGGAAAAANGEETSGAVRLSSETRASVAASGEELSEESDDSYSESNEDNVFSLEFDQKLIKAREEAERHLKGLRSNKDLADALELLAAFWFEVAPSDAIKFAAEQPKDEEPYYEEPPVPTKAIRVLLFALGRIPLPAC